MADISLLPQEFLERLEKLYSSEELKAVKQSFTTDKPVSFRVNSLKASTSEVLELFKAKQLSVTPVPWYPDSFIYEGAKTDLTSLPEYREGKFYIQGLSSMIPALVLNPRPSEKVLDIAAAPGSKTTQIATLMNDSGELVANDISRTRIYKLKDNLKQQGVTNATVLNQPGERLWRKYPEYFDKVLVDAPCSMEGRISTFDPDSYKDWSVKKVKELSHRQEYLLRSAITATKVGGTIVYSTCTLAPEENEGVIDWILAKEGDAIELEEIQMTGLKLQPGLTEWNGKQFKQEVKKTARVRPDDQMEGFFVAKIRKTKTTLKPELFQKS